jgi:uncharacterized membrane protein YoaK (UPF0700 family)
VCYTKIVARLNYSFIDDDKLEFVRRRKPKMQTSESFRLSAILSFSGGLQDAYTYNVRGRVFANAQTGNVVLMSQNFMVKNWNSGMHYVLPLISFAAGVFITEQIEYRYKNSKGVHWRQLVLLIEIVLLGIVGLMPPNLNIVANMLVSFACAMQVQAFRKVHGYGYASTMCIGNLRSGTESLSRFLRNKDRASLNKALHFFGIIVIFAIGAGVGGILSNVLHAKTIWISMLLLTGVAVMMIKENR